MQVRPRTEDARRVALAALVVLLALVGLVSPAGAARAPDTYGYDTPSPEFAAAATDGYRTATNSVREAQEIIQSTARAEAARGVDALKGSLSAAERAALEAFPSLASRYLGQAVHRNTAAALDQAHPPLNFERWAGARR